MDARVTRRLAAGLARSWRRRAVRRRRGVPAASRCRRRRWRWPPPDVKTLDEFVLRVRRTY